MAFANQQKIRAAQSGHAKPGNPSILLSSYQPLDHGNKPLFAYFYAKDTEIGKMCLNVQIMKMQIQDGRGNVLFEYGYELT